LDGGETWQSSESGAKADLWDVAFLNERVGYAVGDNGLVLNTKDGGVNWFSQSVSKMPLYGINLVDKKVGWAVGSKGTIFRTVDGGITWRIQRSDTTAEL
jgi:photosystem II stability/assembly factor-like uncharacterized protein